MPKAIAISEETEQAVAALGVSIRSELGKLMAPKMDSLKSEILTAVTALIDQRFATMRDDLERTKGEPTERQKYEAAYPHALPRILHKNGDQIIVKNVTDCERLLAAGWTLLP